VPYLVGEQAVYTLKGGMGTVCHALAKYLNVRTGMCVTSIRRNAVLPDATMTHSGAMTGAASSTPAVDRPGDAAMTVQFADGTSQHFDDVVCAVEGSLARDLIATPSRAERTMLDSVRYNALGVVHYGFAQSLPPLMHFATRGTPSRIATYQQLPAAPAQGRPLTQIYCQLTPEAADEASRLGVVDQLDTLLRPELQKRLPGFDANLVSVVNQWIPRKLPVFYPGYGSVLRDFWAWQEASARAGEGVPVYCGDWTSQALLTGACASGERAARIVLARASERVVQCATPRTRR
jgi:oxygen-dependent protoporphyrinogen oxidase